MNLSTCPAVTFVLTRDRTQSQPFYQDVLGLTLLWEDDFAAVFDLNGGAILRLTNIENHTPGAHTILGWAVSDIQKAMNDLRQKGVSFIVYDDMTDEHGVWTAPHGAVKVCWFNDPDGNNLSLTQS